MHDSLQQGTWVVLLALLMLHMPMRSPDQFAERLTEEALQNMLGIQQLRHAKLGALRAPVLVPHSSAAS